MADDEFREKKIFSGNDDFDLSDTVDESPAATGYQIMNNLGDGDQSPMAFMDPYEGDALYALASGSSSPSGREQLNTVLTEIAAEAAHLRMLRDYQKDTTGNFAKTSESRLKALKAFAEITVLINKEDADGRGAVVNFHSESFMNVMKLFIGIVTRSLEESGITEEKQKTFLNRFATNMDGFEDKAKRIYLGEDLEEAGGFYGEL